MKCCQVFSACIVLLLGFALARAALSAETEHERHLRIKKLVEALASPNTPPRKVPTAVFPTSYDHDAQSKVLDAWRALLKEGVTAFPELVAHAGDKRYCATLRGGAADRNASVGTVCGYIIGSHLTTYHDRIEYIGRWKPDYRDVALDVWWESSKDKTLLRLQIEAAEHAISETKNYSTADPRRKTNVAKLKSFIIELNAKSEAISVSDIQARMLKDGDRLYFGK